MTQETYAPLRDHDVSLVRSKMKLVVLGATGGTGLEIVRQAIHQGHSVTAFVRSPERLQQFADRINVCRGDLLNSKDLEHAIQGHDAVISAFGPRAPIEKRTRAREGNLPIFGFKISRADVADFMIKAAEDPRSMHKIIGVGN